MLRAFLVSSASPSNRKEMPQLLQLSHLARISCLRLLPLSTLTLQSSPGFPIHAGRVFFPKVPPSSGRIATLMPSDGPVLLTSAVLTLNAV